MMVGGKTHVQVVYTHLALTGDMHMMQCRLARTRSTKQRARLSGVSTKSGLVPIAKGRISAAIMCNSSCFGTEHAPVDGSERGVANTREVRANLHRHDGDGGFGAKRIQQQGTPHKQRLKLKREIQTLGFSRNHETQAYKGYAESIAYNFPKQPHSRQNYLLCVAPWGTGSEFLRS